jgi:hypothetical protein
MLCDTNGELYLQVRNRGLYGQLWSTLTRRPHGLLSLAELTDKCTVSSSSDAGIQAVPIDHIRGSEGRSKDFDRDFNPLQEHTRMRWLSIAAARKAGKSLPPVSLIQVGDVYFVRDGHHRISVARALGQCDVEAQVTVWQVSGALPSETRVPAAAPKRQGHRLEVQRLYERLKEGVTSLQQRCRPALRGLLAVAGPS